MKNQHQKAKLRRFASRLGHGVPDSTPEPVQHRKHRTIPIVPRAERVDISLYWKPEVR